MSGLISVVLPVYNGEKYLSEAIYSILNQTYTNFEFIVINDGSTDKSLEVIEKYESLDERIIVISRENRGLIASLNEGIEIAKGKYIARMDQDDISLPTRFEEQISCLKNSDIDICGTWMEVFDDEKKLYIEKYPVLDHQIKAGLFFRNTVGHPSIMFKKDTILSYENYKDIEDYATWILNSQKLQFYNIPKVLLKYRKHIDNTCSRNNNKQKESISKLLTDIVSEYKLEILIPSEHISVLVSEDRNFSSKNLIDLDNFYLKVLGISFKNQDLFNELKKLIGIKLIKIYFKNIKKLRFANLYNFYKIIIQFNK